ALVPLRRLAQRPLRAPQPLAGAAMGASSSAGRAADSFGSPLPASRPGHGLGRARAGAARVDRPPPAVRPGVAPRPAAAARASRTATRAARPERAASRRRTADRRREGLSRTGSTRRARDAQPFAGTPVGPQR